MQGHEVAAPQPNGLGRRLGHQSPGNSRRLCGGHYFPGDGSFEFYLWAKLAVDGGRIAI